MKNQTQWKLIWLCAAAVLVACAHEKISEAKQEQPAAQPAPVAQPTPAMPAAVPASVKTPAEPSKSEGVITITTSSPEAAAIYVEAVDWLLAGHQDKGLVLLRKALQLDPKLLLVQAMLYYNTPGSEAMQKVDEAAQASASLPEAERTEIEAIDANKHGDYEKARELELKLLSLAPRDWRAHAYVGATAFFYGHRAEEAAGQLHEAASLNPKAISPWSILGAIADEQGNKAEAVEARRKVAEMRPGDPAAQADYSYALLSAGKLDEAERVARKAAAFPNADAKPLAALANVEFYRSEFAQGREDVTKARSLSTDENERFGLDRFALFTHVAEGRYDAALQAASALENEARAAKNPNTVVLAVMDRAFAAALLGKHADGQKFATEAWARSKSEPLSGTGRKDLQRTILVARMWTQALGKKTADAEKTLALMEKDAGDSPNDANVQSAAAWGRGVLKLGSGDAKGAAQEMSKCIASDDLCHFHLVLAQEKAGDKAAAQATRATLLSQQRTRNSFYLVLRQQLLKNVTPRVALN
jgi:tetratricopeptide (TPR) repeat protein